MKFKKDELILRDHLAIDRTKLASERTFLAYFRTSIFFLSAGLSIIKIHLFAEVTYLGWMLVTMSPLTFGIAIFRLIKVRRAIGKRFYPDED